MTPTITPREKELARHALGLDGQWKRPIKNYYVIYVVDDHDVWGGMVKRGLAKRGKCSPLTDGPDWFCLTRAGALAALEEGEELDSEDFPR